MKGEVVRKMDRRGFVAGLGGVFAVTGLPNCLMAKDALFAGRGRFERLCLAYAHVHIGLENPFSILHVSDTHLTAAYGHEAVARTAASRTCTFGGCQEEALASTLAWAKEHVDYVVHTGDLIDFQSEANLALVRKYYGETVFGSMGNHEFYRHVPGEKIASEEPFKTQSWSVLRTNYPVDPRFSSRVVSGVNFICIDNVFGTVQSDQVEMFAGEVKKGIPIVLCMHVPFFTDELYRWTMRYWSSQKQYRCAEIPEPTGDCQRQREDGTTRDFIAYLKGEKLLKALLVGHEHITMEDRFSPTAMEYAVGGNFMFHGREVLFT